MRTTEEIYQSINDDFKERCGDEPGVLMNMYTMAVSKEDEKIYQEIENNKTPHVWTELDSAGLDATGLWVNCPRDVGETDEAYRYRLLQWMLRNEAGNTTAIQTALLNPKYATNIEFVPLTHGCGTGTCYIIPEDYDTNHIQEAMKEAQDKLSKVISPDIYVDYVIPDIRAVSLELSLTTLTGDESAIKEILKQKITSYVNAIAPKDYLSLGYIQKLGVNEDLVEHFNILSLFIDGQQIHKERVLQGLDTKFILDTITWVEEDVE